MIEIHPFGNFVPKKVIYLMLGSFTTKPKDNYEWFYANGRNQFWPIMEEVYGLKFNTKNKQQKLFSQLKMALADIILSCERRNNSNLDMNLFNIVYNTDAITNIIEDEGIKKIFFTSRYVETLFRKLFKAAIGKYPKIELVTLPSPSPRYALITKAEKIKRYRKLLPGLSQSVV
jgi:hypoxanthine-DNA glycosylase